MKPVGASSFTLLPSLSNQGICGWIEIQTAGNGERHGELRTADEGKCIRVAISTTAEVSVERGDDGILAGVVVGMTLPLSDARAAGIGHDQGTNLLEVIKDAITLGRIANLLRTRVDDELSLHLDALLVSLAGHACRTGQILIGRVGTAYLPILLLPPSDNH